MVGAHPPPRNMILVGWFRTALISCHVASEASHCVGEEREGDEGERGEKRGKEEGCGEDMTGERRRRGERKRGQKEGRAEKEEWREKE